MNFVESLTDEMLYDKMKYTSTEGKHHERALWGCTMHLAKHGTQHKTEAAAILTGFGHSPGDIDLILYLNEAGGFPQTLAAPFAAYPVVKLLSVCIQWMPAIRNCS